MRIIYGHPFHKRSRVNRAMRDSLEGLENVDILDLYDTYPNFYINIEKEKDALLKCDFLLLQHPFYWYSLPALLKHWIDEVLEYGWAYGEGGDKLIGKYWMQAITTGSSEKVYRREGRNHFTVEEFLRPHEQTALLCGMKPVQPFLIQGTGDLSADEISAHAVKYRQLVKEITEGKIPKTYNTFEGR